PPPTGSNTRITVSSDVDMFKVTAPDDGALILTADSNFFDESYLEIFDTTGKSLATADSNNSQILGENTLSYQLTAGDTYYVAVTVPANAGFNPSDPFVGRAAA